METYVHDGQGTYFDPDTVQVSTLSGLEAQALSYGDTSVLTGDPLHGPTPAFGYDGSGQSTDDLMRVIRLWLPYAEVGEDNYGQIVIYTGLNDTGEGELTPFEGTHDAQLADDYPAEDLTVCALCSQATDICDQEGVCPNSSPNTADSAETD